MRSIVVVALLVACFSDLVARDVVIRSGTIRASVDDASGAYTVASTRIPWQLHGVLESHPTNVVEAKGSDHLGTYAEILFRWSGPSPMKGSIRVYGGRDAVLFTETTLDSMPNAPPPFPHFRGLPSELHLFTYSEHEFGVPPVFGHVGRNDTQSEKLHSGPVVLFDDSARTCVLSPASDFMVGAILEGDESSLSSGLLSSLARIPPGYSYKTLIVLEDGINRAWNVWGNFLTDLYGKKRPSNEADVGLRYLGYWTDNGATYYYNYDTTRGYEGTLVAELAHLDSVKIPIRYLQLDSWWYLKGFTPPDGKTPEHPGSKNPLLPAGQWNRYGGLLEYVPSPELFPGGLRAFHDRIRMPLITHNRWIEQDSRYHEEYEISGIAALDPRWWDKITSDLSSWGVQTYEQDWQSYIYRYSPAFVTTTSAGERFFDEMARACAKHGLTMQYCMSLPRCFLQGGARYPNLTTIRVSGDRFERAKWKEFLYGSRLASAMGVWPWADVFMSSERDNLLLATLSGGMVGIGDEYGKESPDNVSFAVRPDGVIVKPDASIVPTDATVLADARGERVGRTAFTFTGKPGSKSGGRIFYFFSYNDDSSTVPNLSPLQNVGLEGEVFVYDFYSGKGHLQQATETLPAIAARATQYKVVVPVPRCGIAIIGDPGKFVTRGRQRIAQIVERSNGSDVSIFLAQGESNVALVGYSRTEPVVRAVGGSVQLTGYDKVSGQFTLEVRKMHGTPAHLERGDMVATIKVQIRRRAGE